jgi:excinuclease ABC subunit A
VSGAGKSTLLHDVIKPAAQAFAGRAGKRGKVPTGPWRKLEGFERFTSVYEVDQAPIGKTSRSTPATYIGLMDEIRGLFARLPLARQRGYEASRFSFNSGSGRCPACQGQGAVKVEMSFLPSTFVPCETCRGRRYGPETLEVLYNGKSIADVLDLTIEQAVDFFADVPRLYRPLALLRDTGLGYLTLGQRSPTLSGGEAQRIKLVAELARSLEMNTQKRLKTRGFGSLHHLYLLEEPTIGPHGHRHRASSRRAGRCGPSHRAGAGGRRRRRTARRAGHAGRSGADAGIGHGAVPEADVEARLKLLSRWRQALMFDLNFS